MRPQPIAIPGGFNSAWNRQRERMANKRGGEEFKFLAADGREIERPGVQGWALLYDQPLLFEGQIVVFAYGAFGETIADGKMKQLLFDHDESRQYCTTSTGLEFASTADGLAFRMPLAGHDGRAVYGAVSTGERACVSVGCVFDRTSKRRISGIDVLAIERASLKEISLCRQGKVPETCATVVDLDDENPYLFLAARSPSERRRR
jgi:HK97 family phage prohead protease